MKLTNNEPRESRVPRVFETYRVVNTVQQIKKILQPYRLQQKDNSYYFHMYFKAKLKPQSPNGQGH